MSEKNWCERNPDHPSWRGNGACWECNTELLAEVERLQMLDTEGLAHLQEGNRVRSVAIEGQKKEIERLSCEVTTANAREREAFMAGCQYAGKAPPDDWDQEQGWQQYRCQDETDWKVVSKEDAAKIDAAVSEELAPK